MPVLESYVVGAQVRGQSEPRVSHKIIPSLPDRVDGGNVAGSVIGTLAVVVLVVIAVVVLFVVIYRKMHRKKQLKRMQLDILAL